LNELMMAGYLITVRYGQGYIWLHSWTHVQQDTLAFLHVPTIDRESLTSSASRKSFCRYFRLGMPTD